MPQEYVVVVEGMKGLLKLGENLSADIELAAQRAINKTADFTRARAAKLIREKIAFPARFLDPSQGNLSIVKRASAASLEAIIRGRASATSLARFQTGTASGREGVSVMVKPGMATFMRRAFLIKLGGNTGVAIRLPRGKPMTGKNQPRKISNGLYVLYGPSVDQVFRTVSVDLAEPTAAKLQEEFLRLIEAETKHGKF